MSERHKSILDNNSLNILLKANLSCCLGEQLTTDKVDKITLQIVESIGYVLNNTKEVALFKPPFA